MRAAHAGQGMALLLLSPRVAQQLRATHVIKLAPLHGRRLLRAHVVGREGEAHEEEMYPTGEEVEEGGVGGGGVEGEGADEEEGDGEEEGEEEEVVVEHEQEYIVCREWVALEGIGEREKVRPTLVRLVVAGGRLPGWHSHAHDHSTR